MTTNPSPPDWRGLCAELAQQLDDALDFTVSSETRRYMKELTGRARAALAEPVGEGRPAPAPAEGEVAKLVRWLRRSAGCADESQMDLRAADLLEQRHPAPVPVASDTYFEFVISDADDCTQAGGIAPTYAQALSEGQHYLAQYQQDGPHTLELRRVEVLPPGAFPVPDDAPVPLPDDALSYPPKFRCQCCGGEEPLDLPLPVVVVARMSKRFERKNRNCKREAGV